MSERNREAVQAYVGSFHRRDLDAACATFSSDALVYGVLGNCPLEITRAIWQELISTNDMRLTIDSMVAVKFIERGKSIGSFRGLPATGKSYEITAME